MRISKLILGVLACSMLASLSAFASDFTIIPQPTPAYTSGTTLYTPNVGDGNDFSTLGPFSFSTPLNQRSVPNTWATWACPPATESCTPVVGFTNGADSLTITFAGQHTVGFELEPDAFQVDEVTAQFFSGTTLIGTIDLFPDGNAGALLFAATSMSDAFTSIVITDLNNDDFAIANLRSGGEVGGGVPEPGSLLLLGSGLLGGVGVLRRKMAR